MPAVTSYVSFDHRLGNENIYSPRAKLHPVQWTLWRKLDDLDYTDDLAFLSHTRHQMQETTSAVADASARLGLKIHKEKSKVLKVNTITDPPIIWKVKRWMRWRALLTQAAS